jgi:hypothetical protein
MSKKNNPNNLIIGNVLQRLKVIHLYYQKKDELQSAEAGGIYD